MVPTADLTDYQWQIAHTIAQKLVLEEADANELGKALVYLGNSHGEDGGERFFKYLQTLANQGKRIGHSKRTSGYYQSMAAICTEHLQVYQQNVEVMEHILGWAFRLIRYYKNAVPIGELEESVAESNLAPVASERQAEIAEVLASQSFNEGDILDAKVANIKGNKVTYEILVTTQKLTQKEPKKAKILTEEQAVKVEIVSLKDDGSIKKVKLMG